MTLHFIFGNIKANLLKSIIFIVSIALSLSLILCVFNVSQQIEDNFVNNSRNYNLVITAEGSKTQAVMSTVYFTESPIGNISYCVYEELEQMQTQGQYGLVKVVPVALGDQIEGFTLVGTTAQYLDDYTLLEGTSFSQQQRGLVLGYYAARTTGLGIGDSVKSTHGGIEGHEHDEGYVVCGILEKTNTPADNAVYTAIDNIWHAHEEGEHEGEGEGEHEHEHGDITALLILASVGGQSMLQTDIANGTFAEKLEEDGHSHSVAVMASNINAVFRDLLDNISFVTDLLKAILVLVFALCLIIVFLIVFSSISERRRELAVLRVIGFSKAKTTGLILLENLTLGIFGLVGALLTSRIILAVLSLTVGTSLGAQVNLFLLTGGEIVAIILTPLLVVAASLLPIFAVYGRTSARYLR